jgi:hypothetical protein
VVMGRSISLALLLLLLAVPASASALDPGQTVGGAGSKWTSGDLLTQTGENCSVLGNPYTEPMISGIASYGGTAGVPVVNQRYYTAFLVSVPGTRAAQGPRPSRRTWSCRPTPRSTRARRSGASGSQAARPPSES